MKTRIFCAVALLLLNMLNNADAQANRSMSNLIAPTAINQSLLPNSSNTKDLGNSTLGWKDIYICKSGPLNSPNRRNQLFINKGINSAGNVTFIDSAKEYGIDNLGFSIQATFFDYDRDGDLDMYLSSNSPSSSNTVIGADQGMRLRTGGGSKLYNRQGNRFVDVTTEAGIYSSPIGFGLGIATADINRDGWPDLYVANDFFEKDYLYINQHNGTFKESINKNH